MTDSISDFEELLMADWVPGDLLSIITTTGFCPTWNDWVPHSRGKLGHDDLVILIDLRVGDSPNQRFIWVLTKFGGGWVRRKHMRKVG